jgi:CHAD domain-containing protein
MPITVDLGFLTTDEQKQLARIMRNPQDLDAALQPFAQAAFEEYARMMIGQRVFTRGSDIREYRLFLLVKHAFGQQLPDEQRVCDLFQTTASEGRSLIRSVISKYQYDLQGPVMETLKEIVKKAKQQNGDHTIVVNSRSIVEALNRMLAAEDGSLPPIEKKAGTVSTYVVRPSSYNQLKKRLEI